MRWPLITFFQCTPDIQIIFSAVKTEKFHSKSFVLLNVYVQNIGSVYQSMFWIKKINKKEINSTVNPSFTIKSWVSRWYNFHGHIFLMYNLLSSWFSQAIGTCNLNVVFFRLDDNTCYLKFKLPFEFM